MKSRSKVQRLTRQMNALGMLTAAQSSRAWGELMKLSQLKEPLHPELAACLYRTSFGQQICHPLVKEVFYTAAMNAVYNRRLAQLQTMTAAHLKRHQYLSWLSLHERPHRMEKLHWLAFDSGVRVRMAGFREAARWAWVDSENLWQFGTVRLRALLDYVCDKCPGGMMDPGERRVVARMRPVLTVYRGWTKGRGAKAGTPYGFSWTLNPRKAAWFAGRFAQTGDSPMVTRGVVRREDIIAYKAGRSESEIIIDPEDVAEQTAEQAVRRAA